MKYMLVLILGATIGTSIFSCAGGKKSIKYKDLPHRNNQSSVWIKCKDGDYDHVCKYECTKYKSNNKCKNGHEKTKKLNIKLALDQGNVMMSKSLWIKYMRERH